MQLENKVVIEDLIPESNNERCDVASNIFKMSDFNFLGIIDPSKDVLQCLGCIFCCGNEDVNSARYVFQVGGNCLREFWVKDVKKSSNFLGMKIFFCLIYCICIWPFDVGHLPHVVDVIH